MKICVLVKEVPDAAVEKRIDPSTGRLDRSGEKNLNPFDTHAIEAAMQLKEGGAIEVDEVVAVTMGPDTAVRALHKAVSLDADLSTHLTDEALAGSDVNGTGYALAQVLKREYNPRYYDMMKALEVLTGNGVSLNTSLNRRGEPMICSPTDALNMFFGSDLQYLIMEDILVVKDGAAPYDQPL